MSDSLQDAARRAWQGQASAPGGDQAARLVEQRLREQGRQVRRFLGSAAVIIPSWLAVLIWFPDLRPVAMVGLAAGAGLGWQVYRRTRPVARPESAGLPCAAFQVEALTRERDFQRSISGWGLVPVVVAQLAIVATLVLNERFEKNPAFVGSLSAFIIVIVAVLAFVVRRGRRTMAELDREIAVLKKVAEV